MSKNIDADRVNETQLGRLSGPMYSYEAVDCINPAPEVERLTYGERTVLQTKFTDGSFRAPPKLEIKLHSQVMLLRNQQDDASLVNGSRGVVTGFEEAPDLIKKLHEKLKALNIHDQQERSRIEKQIQTLSKSNQKHYPIVLFQTKDGEPGTTKTMIHKDFNYRLHGVGEAIRMQVPLMLAWAISIHKSQGMSINDLAVSVSDAFAEGQAYGAISRATSKDGLMIRTWRDSCVKVNKKALAFDMTSTVVETWDTKAEREWPAQLKEALRLQAIPPPKCNCEEPARRSRKRSAGANQGRHFWTCQHNRNNRNNCGFFQWFPLEEER